MTGEDLLERARTDRRDLFNMERLKQGMAAQGLDGILAVSPVNVTYTGGALMPTRNPIGLLSFVVTTQDGEQGVVINEADAYCFREYSWIEDIRPFRYVATTAEGNQQAIIMLVDLLREMGLNEGKLGVEETDLPVLCWEDLSKRLPRAKLVEGSHVLEYARLVKTPSEIELYRLAALYTDKAIHTGLTLARPGDTEKAVASQIQANLLKLGAENVNHATIHAGEHSTVVHAWPLEAKRLELGEVIHIDFGALFGGYTTDIARNAVVGRAGPKHESIYQRLHEIQHLIFEHMRPGIRAGDLFDLAQPVFKEAGLVYPWGTLGHSIGLMVHDEFEIAHGSEKPLEAGMLINIEPTHIEQGVARYHIEDTVLVKEEGVEILSNFMSNESMFLLG